MKLNLEKELSTALAAAQKAGQMALAYQGRPMEVALKDGLRDSPVTEADRVIDQYLKDTFTQAYQQDAWLSEETADDNSRFEKQRCWVVDPIDGTTGFIRWLFHGMPREDVDQNRRQFSISIALVEDGVPVLGVVYAPLKEQMMHAIRGQGVFINGQPVQRQETAQSLKEATYLSSVSEVRDGLLQFLEGKTQMKSFGSVAYKLALTAVSSNVVAASVKPKNAWDLAAGHLLCEEAGLKVTDLAGNALRYDVESTVYQGFIAAPETLYPALFDVLPNQPTGGYQ